MPHQHRPPVSLPGVPRLIEELYGIRVHVVRELESYDDRNVLVEMDQNSPTPPGFLGKTGCDSPGRFLLKVHHETFSANPQMLEVKNSLISHLTMAGYPTPRLYPTLTGSLQSLVHLRDPDTEREGNHVIKLFEFLPGLPMDKICLTKSLCREMGALTGWMDKLWMDFPIHEHQAVKDLKIHWNLSELPEVKTKLDFVRDKRHIPILMEIISRFESTILQSQETFSKGIIHSDINDANVLVQKATDGPDCVRAKSSCRNCVDGTYKVSGVIDFGDLTHSLYIFELAIAVAYAMLNKDIEPAESGAAVVAGYLEHMTLPKNQLIHLHTCVCARLAQSFIYGEVALAQDESNAEYTQNHASRCMPLIEYLWTLSDTQFLNQLQPLK